MHSIRYSITVIDCVRLSNISPVFFERDFEDMLGFKQKIDDGLVPKSNFPNIQDLLKEPDFNVEIQRKKSNAAAGLTDFIININVYNDRQ